MELEFWGVRGTHPVSGREGSRYGGHTAAALITAKSGDRVIVDAGTGMIGLGRRMTRDSSGSPKQRVHVLLTHFHLDHIMGLPFFSPLQDKNTAVTFFSAAEPAETERLLSGIMAGRYFPLDFQDLAAAKHFKKLPQGKLEIGSLLISHHPLSHPQGSAAYRIEEGGQSVVFATDTEHPLKGLDDSLAAFAQGAGHFIYDATFTPQDYEVGKRGWGHSTWLEGTKLARAACVGTLYLSHLNPEYPDKTIDELVRLAREEFPRTRAAREGWKKVFRGE
ncbi:MAG: MBL fold metallo-hydrolase [Candidatus Aminicenantes bacterium]|nr:MBL fold metallo-hydrolase [Candidatus Aminicenantes bacterium]